MFKTLVIIINLMVIVLVPASAQDSNYKWYNGEKIFYEINHEKKFIVFANDISFESLEKLIGESWEIISFGNENIINSLYETSRKRNYEGTRHATIGATGNIITLNSFEGLEYESTYLKSKRGNDVGVSNVFYVNLKNQVDIHLLEELSTEYKVEIIGKNKFMPLWFTIKCTKNSKNKNAMEIANIFYESNLFANCAPSLILGSLTHCVNDDFWNNQWGLDNSGGNGGTAGVDINYCNSRNITTGDINITVAVFDHGIELNHPDMPNVLAGFDTESNSVPSVLHGGHGTACAGIISADDDNNIGISGVSPNSTLLSISNDLAGTDLGDEQRLADGLNWAWQNGADIISNSWGHDDLQNPIIDAAITNALSQGRNGLGCVVVFSSGNSDGAYPANSNPDILAVGAIDRCGIRSGTIGAIPNSCDPWGGSVASQFGAELDVVAPGTSIWTTDRVGAGGYNNTDYTGTFGGTSAATPFVSGLAGLILSLDPCLTNIEVNTIIENSGQKVGGVTYQNVANRPNGTWHEEYGYGLINAGNALVAVTNVFLQSDNETGSLLVTSMDQIRAGSNVAPQPTVVPIAPYIVESGANVEFKATNLVVMEDGFVALYGSEFLSHIEPFNGDCVVWNTPRTWKHITEITTDELEIISEKSVSKNKNEPMFFPNPHSNELYLKFVLESDQEVELYFYSVTGEIIEQKNIAGYAGENTRKIDFETTENLIIVKIVIDSEIFSSKLIRN